MPLLVVVFAALAMVVFMALLLPLSIFYRYRASTARRRARNWVATVNVYGIGLSATLFLVSATITNFWVPNALRNVAIGMLTGFLLGMIGVAITRWEITPQSIHFTPNRWLVSSITLLVIGRIGFGFWRGWQTWRATADQTSLLAAIGVAGSMGAGAVVIGYYLMYWIGLRRRLSRIPR